MRNTDDLAYGGSGVTNLGHVEAEELPWNGRPASVSLRAPRSAPSSCVPAGTETSGRAGPVHPRS